MKLEVLIDEPMKCAYGEITEAHTKRLEKQILQKPQYWLWTHKRWKRSKNLKMLEQKFEDNNQIN